MKKVWIGMILLLIFAIGCSNGGSSTPTQPATGTTTSTTDTTKISTDTTKIADTTKTTDTTTTKNDTTTQPVTYNIVKSTTPEINWDLEPYQGSVSVTFTEEIDPKTIDSTTFFVTSNGKTIPGKITVSQSYLTAYFEPNVITWYVPSGWDSYDSMAAYWEPSSDYAVKITSGIKTLWTHHQVKEHLWGFNTKKDTNAPSSPGFSAYFGTGVTLNGRNAHLTWKGFGDNYWVTGYKVYRNGTLLTAITGVNNTSCDDLNLSPSTTYGYSITAIDATGNESNKSAIQWCTTSAN